MNVPMNHYLLQDTGNITAQGHQVVSHFGGFEEGVSRVVADQLAAAKFINFVYA